MQVWLPRFPGTAGEAGEMAVILSSGDAGMSLWSVSQGAFCFYSLESSPT